MNEECKSNECTCESEDNFFHVKVIQRDGGPIVDTDSMGREKFWEDLGRPDGE
jgi:hypothetical protein